MPAVTSAPSSGDTDIEGLLSGVQWAVASFTFSFPTSGSFYGTGYSPDNEPANNFEALNSTQRSVARAIFDNYASVAAVSFSELTESATVHADLRLAESNDPSTAWGYYPSESAAGGDSWYNNTGNRFDNPVKGNYAYDSFIHELGHNMGLEHGHDTADGDAMTAAHDSMAYSVMTYRSYPGQSTSGGYTNETWGYAQSLMMYDIAALQHMYGANYGSNAGDTTYSWSTFTGELSINGAGQGTPGGNRVFMTLWDGGGVDTYDFSNYTTAVTADLSPGAWTTMSQEQRAALGGGRLAEGNVANALLSQGDLRSIIENVSGGSGSDILTGNQAANIIRGNVGNDVLSGLGGADSLDGGAGNDTLVYTISGLDTLEGGADNDTADFSGFVSAVMVNLPHAYAWTTDSSSMAVGTSRQIAVVRNVENIIGTSQDDRLTGFIAGNRIDGGAGHDTITGGTGNDTLIGGAGNDIFDGYVGNDTITGGAGNDTLVYSYGLDTMDGGADNDTADFSGFAYAVMVNLPHEYAWTTDSSSMAVGTSRQIAVVRSVENIVGTSQDDRLTGFIAGNRIDGGAGHDTITGGTGDDTLIGGTGNDTLDGYLGNDTLVYSDGLDTMDGGAGNDTVDFSGFASAVMVNLPNEYAWTTDSSALTGTWRQIAVVRNVENIIGTSQDDRLTGFIAGNRIDGGAGHDTITGGTGDDTLLGGTGNDILDGYVGNDVMDGGAGNDVVTGSYGNDTLIYSGGMDTLDGGVDSDTVDFSGFAYAVMVNLPNEYAWTTDSTSMAVGTSRQIAVVRDVENIIGTSQDDRLTGFRGEGNRIDGGAGNDTITGGTGNDTLIGGAGADTLTGLSGSDRFDYNAITHGLDTIIDFTRGAGGDVLDVRDVLVGYMQGSSNAANFVQLAQSESNTNVSVNADGAGSDFVQLATLQGVTGALLNDMLAQGNLALA